MTSGIKIVTLGEAMTGKTSICNRLTRNEFIESTDSTIGASFLILKTDDIKFEIWDTAGQERYMSLSPLYYRSADIILLIYDASNLKTIDRTILYLDKILNEPQTKYSKIIFVGNKSDLVDDETIDTINKLIKKKTENYESIKDKLDDIIISAKTGNNFINLLNTIKETGKNIISSKQPEKDTEIIILSSTKTTFFPFNKTNYCPC